MYDRELLALVVSAMQEETGALEKLCEAKAKDVLYICISLMGSVEDGEDAAQEVLLKMQLSIHRLRKAQAFPAWLNRIISSVCNNMRKHGLRYAETTLLEADTPLPENNVEFLPDELLLSKESQQSVLRAMQTLPVQYRQALLLFYYEDMSMRDIALAMQRDERAVKNLLFRARGALRKQLEKEEDRNMGTIHPVAGAVPVLSHILKEDAALVCTEESVRRIAVASIAAAQAATAATAGATGAVLGAKTSVTILSAILAATVGITAAVGGIPQDNSFGSPPAAGSDSMTEGPPALLAPGPAGEGSNGLAGGLATANNTEPGYPWQQAATSASSTPQGADNSPSTEGNSGDTAASAGAPGNWENPPGAAQAPEAFVYTGQVEFTDKTGQVVLGAAGGLTQNSLVTLYLGETEVATGQVGANGAYTLETQAPLQQTGYTLRLAAAANTGWVYTAANPAGACTFVPEGRELPTLYITDNQAPTGSIQFYKADGTALGGASVLPHTARVVAEDATATTATWRITAQGETTILASGSGKAAEIPGALYPAGSGDATYTICFTITDLAGNQTDVQRDFVLYR